MNRRFILPLVLAAFLLALVGVASAIAPAQAAPQGGTPDGAGTLTLLHNNDGESSLLPLQNSVMSGTETISLDVAGVAAFKTLTDQNIAEGRAAGNAVMNVYAGDAFLASATLACSLPPNDPATTPIYDAVAQRQIAYDAHIIGNHEFDYSPDFLERFIRAFDDGSGLDQPFLSANLDFSAEAGFDDLVDADGLLLLPVTDGRVVARSALYVDPDTGQRFGIVGATTPELPTISTPRDVTVTPDLATTAVEVQEEIDRLYDEYGVRKIVFVSHLQDVDNDLELIPLLRRVDIAVAGGGDELLENPAIPDEIELLPGEGAPIEGTYPLTTADADGRTVYIVTTAGNYKYLGRIDARFDENGEVSEIISESSYPRRVIPDSAEADSLGVTDSVAPDPGIVATVIDPVVACLDALAATVVATSEVLLDVSRAGVRSTESNAGNLITDGFIFTYDRLEELNGLPPRDQANVIAVQNGGGIRQNAGDVLPVGGVVPGTISRLDTINVLPFDNFMTVVGNVTPDDMKSILERSAESLPGQGGQFLQMSGLRVVYNTAQPIGSRVVSATLEDGTAIIADYAVVPGAPSVYVVTNSFTARGGDDYPEFAANPDQTRLLDENGLAVSYEQPFREYMQSFPNATIPDDDPRYQPGGEGRITFINEPAAVQLGALEAAPSAPAPWGWLAAAGLALGLALLLRRRA